MKKFGFSFSVIFGILCAWIISIISFHAFIINLAVPLFSSGFLTSFLVSKDSSPPKLLKKIFSNDKETSILRKRIGAGIFSSVIFVFSKTTYIFLNSTSSFGNNPLNVLGFYALSVSFFIVLGIILGAIGGKTGVIVRDYLQGQVS